MPDNLISITHISSYFIASPLHSELVVALDKRGLRQQVFVPVQHAEHVNRNLPKELRQSNIYYSQCFNTLHRYLWPLKMLRIWRSFKKQYEKHPPKLIHAHSLFANGLIAYWAHKKWGSDYVVSVRFTDLHFFLEKALLFKKTALKILLHSRAIVFLSPAYRNEQIKRFFNDKEYQMILGKSAVIPNGINPFWLSNRQFSNGPKSKRKLVFVGSLIKRKNLSTLIKACDHLNKEGFYIELGVVGNGPLFKSIKKLPRITKVDFLGKVSDKSRLLEVYRQSDMLVVPSFIETFGLVYPEAMSQGLPVIYTRGQGFDGYFPDGHVGYAVNPKNPHEIAEKIKLVYQDYDRISTNAFNESALFSWENVSDKLISLYKNA